MRPLVLKVCVAVWKNASRDKRELSVYKQLGSEVLVMSQGKPEDKGRMDMVDGFPVRYYSARPLGLTVPIFMNRTVAFFQWVIYARRIKPNVISGRNWRGLLIGWISTWFLPNGKKPKLIYDSHEFEIGRSGERSKAAKWAVTHIERFLIKRCAFSMMVNDSIADEVQRIHKLKERPVVVRNAAPLWERDDDACAEVRRSFCKELSIPENTFIVMYHGGVMQNRGVENMLRAISMTQGTAGVVLGNGDAAYLSSLKQLAAEIGVSDRVLFHEAVPLEILKNYVGAVDCGMVTVPATCMSYYYMLPNKFFENVQSETPIIGSNFPEISRLVNKYDIGLLCDPAKPEEMAACIDKMMTSKEMYAGFKRNLKIAKQELCWENEKKLLIEAYGKIM